jgi:hypothetical protein
VSPRGCSVAFAQTDPRIGTWKLNLTESKVPPNERAPGSDTRTYEATPDGTKMTWVVVDAKGVSHTITYTAKLDGKDYPASGAPNFDTVAFRLLTPKTLEMTLKKAGVVVVGPATVEVSQDGMRMTQTIPTGTAVFDRVK